MSDTFYKPGIPVPAWRDEVYSTGNVITASSNTTINSYNVPSLTPEQIIETYNTIVSGHSVTITDATGNMHFVVDQADTIGDVISICFNYFNTMLLTYDDSGSITFVEL